MLIVVLYVQLAEAKKKGMTPLTRVLVFGLWLKRDSIHRTGVGFLCGEEIADELLKDSPC